MEQFDTLEKIKELFKQANCSTEGNACYFAGFVDYSTNAAVVGGVLGGAIGGAIGAAVAYSNGMVQGMNCKCDGFLIMQTEEGLGMIPLVRDGVALVNSYKKMNPNIEFYFFINNDEINEIKVKKGNFGATVRITLKLKDKRTIKLVANKKDKYLPYQEENVSKFYEQYK